MLSSSDSTSTPPPPPPPLPPTFILPVPKTCTQIQYHLNLLNTNLYKSSGGSHTIKSVMCGNKLSSNCETIVEDEAIKLLNDERWVIVSHDSHDDPKFNFVNKGAEMVFDYESVVDDDDDDCHPIHSSPLLSLPSRLSTPKDNPSIALSRTKMLNALHKKETGGFTSNYSGIRVTSKNALFEIHGAMVWDLFDEDGTYVGQGAMFDGFEVNYLYNLGTTKKR
jgi:hypothetical protein